MKNAHHARMSAMYGAQNPSFGSAVVANGCHFNQHAVSMHCGADGMGRNEDVGLQSRFQTPTRRGKIRNYKSKPIAMQAQFSCYQILPGSTLRDCVSIAIDLSQLATRDHLLQSAREFFARIPVQAQF